MILEFPPRPNGYSARSTLGVRVHPSRWGEIMKAIIVLAGLLAFVLTAGPASAQLPNLAYFVNSDLTYPLTPTATYPPGTAFLPPTLPGNMDTIYLSKGIISTGPGDVAIASNGTFPVRQAGKNQQGVLRKIVRQ